jgi:hypothetical protein
MVHPDVMPGESGISGIGMIAARPLPAGAIVWAPCKLCAVWSSREFAAFAEKHRQWIGEFGYWLDDGSVLLVCGSGYFFNHSCNANVESNGLDFAVALHDIPKGAELTIDYREFRNEPDWAFWCRCDTSAHRVSARSEVGAAARDWRRAFLDRALTRAASQSQSSAPDLATCSKTYREWLRVGHITYDVASICDSRTGLEEPARSSYLTQEMARNPAMCGGESGGHAAGV